MPEARPPLTPVVSHAHVFFLNPQRRRYECACGDAVDVDELWLDLARPDAHAVLYGDRP